MKNIALFLFAHQDDEFAVLEEIYTTTRAGKEVYCIYVTRGVKENHSSNIRNNESIKVLTKLGVKNEFIINIGDILSVHDGELINSLTKTFDWILSFISKHNKNITVYIPAWEGGHPDHDCLNIISIKAIEKYRLLDKSFQYPLYNRHNCIGPFFRLFHPLSSNGLTIKKYIPFLRRIWYLSFIYEYKSQRKTWIGLLPATIIHYIFIQSQILQKVNSIQIIKRPHNGKLYYEYRNFIKWEILSRELNAFLNIS